MPNHLGATSGGGKTTFALNCSCATLRDCVNAYARFSGADFCLTVNGDWNSSFIHDFIYPHNSPVLYASRVPKHLCKLKWATDKEPFEVKSLDQILVNTSIKKFDDNVKTFVDELTLFSQQVSRHDIDTLIGSGQFFSSLEGALTEANSVYSLLDTSPAYAPPHSLVPYRFYYGNSDDQVLFCCVFGFNEVLGFFVFIKWAFSLWKHLERKLVFDALPYIGVESFVKPISGFFQKDLSTLQQQLDQTPPQNQRDKADVRSEVAKIRKSIVTLSAVGDFSTLKQIEEACEKISSDPLEIQSFQEPIRVLSSELNAKRYSLKKNEVKAANDLLTSYYIMLADVESDMPTDDLSLQELKKVRYEFRQHTVYCIDRGVSRTMRITPFDVYFNTGVCFFDSLTALMYVPPRVALPGGVNGDLFDAMAKHSRAEMILLYASILDEDGFARYRLDALVDGTLLIDDSLLRNSGSLWRTSRSTHRNKIHFVCSRRYEGDTLIEYTFVTRFGNCVRCELANGKASFSEVTRVQGPKSLWSVDNSTVHAFQQSIGFGPLVESQEPTASGSQVSQIKLF